MYIIQKLARHSNLFHAFSTKSDGNMSYFFNNKSADKKVVLENRRRFLKKLRIDINDCIGIWVKGGRSVFVADRSLAGKSMLNKKYAVRCDGLITSQKGLFLFLLIADCLPIILFDSKRKVVGVVHAGWKGVNLNIAKHVVNKLITNFSVDPKDLIVGFGPAAFKDSFIKKNPIQRKEKKWKPFLEKVDEGKYKIDFIGLCKKQLIDKGIEEKNIFESGIDTVKNNRFFSHFKDKDKSFEEQGRFACIVGLQ